MQQKVWEQFLAAFQDGRREVQLNDLSPDRWKSNKKNIRFGACIRHHTARQRLEDWGQSSSGKI